MVVVGSGDPSQVQQATMAVQQLLEPLYGVQ